MAYVEGVPLGTRNPFLRLVFWLTRWKLGRVVAPVRGYAHNGWVLFGAMLLELCFERAKRVAPELKMLAEVRVASLVGCRFCIDIGSALVQRAGLSEEALRDLPRWWESERFTEDQRLVLGYADRLSRTPVPEDPAQMAALRVRFTEPQLVELTAAIAHEHMRARLNHGLGYGAEGFSDAALCVVASVRDRTASEVESDTARAAGRSDGSRAPRGGSGGPGARRAPAVGGG